MMSIKCKKLAVFRVSPPLGLQNRERDPRKWESLSASDGFFFWNELILVGSTKNPPVGKVLFQFFSGFAYLLISFPSAFWTRQSLLLPFYRP